MSLAKDYRLVYQQALLFLSRREHSTKELVFKLSKKGLKDSLIKQCVIELKQQNYLSDERFTEMYCRSKVSRRYGPIKIGYELEQYGITKSSINKILSLYEKNFIDNAIYLIEKKMVGKPSKILKNNLKEKYKIIHSLKLKGYDYDLINISLGYFDDE